MHGPIRDNSARTAVASTSTPPFSNIFQFLTYNYQLIAFRIHNINLKERDASIYFSIILKKAPTFTTPKLITVAKVTFNPSIPSEALQTILKFTSI